MKKTVIGLLGSCLFFTPQILQAQEQGIDVSEWQKDISFASVKQAGINSVYIKASEGFDYIDPYFEQNYANAKASGLQVGFYHYLTATTTQEAYEQANWFAHVIDGKQVELKFALDYEDFHNESQEEISAIALTFLNRMEELTKQPSVLYTYAYAANHYFTLEVANYDLWVADYGVSSPTLSGPWKTYSGWQYSDAGRVAGIGPNVDRDVFEGSIYLSSSTSIDTPEYTPTSSNAYVYVRVRYGDTLWAIARQYNTTIQSIISLNGIEDRNLIYPGQILKVHLSKQSDNQTQNIVDNTNGTFNYTVQSGNTLSEIALRYGTTVERLVMINRIEDPNLIYTGQTIRIPTLQVETPSYLYYRVVYGDTLSEIALRYGTSVDTLVAINDITNKDLIYVNQVLKIPN